MKTEANPMSPLSQRRIPSSKFVPPRRDRRLRALALLIKRFLRDDVYRY